MTALLTLLRCREIGNLIVLALLNCLPSPTLEAFNSPRQGLITKTVLTAVLNVVLSTHLVAEVSFQDHGMLLLV